MENSKTMAGFVNIKCFTYEEIISKISESSRRIPFLVEETKYYVKMNSQRYVLFKDQKNCQCCGLEGVTFILQHNLNQVNYHFNLYAKENDDYVLMTKDHIQPKSKGGKNLLSNYNTTCAICNHLKDNCEINYSELFKLRLIWNENINKINKKELLKIIREERACILNQKES
jgi:hypothetical protein